MNVVTRVGCISSHFWMNFNRMDEFAQTVLSGRTLLNHVSKASNIRRMCLIPYFNNIHSHAVQISLPKRL